MLLFLQCTAITQLMCGVQTAHYCVANLLLRYISTKLCRFQSKFDKVVVKTKEYTFYWDNKYITVSLLASQNLACGRSLTLLSVPTVKNLKFPKSKMAAAAILKN